MFLRLGFAIVSWISSHKSIHVWQLEGDEEESIDQDPSSEESIDQDPSSDWEEEESANLNGAADAAWNW